MEALKFDAVKKLLTLTQTEIPKIQNDLDVLIKVAYAGICGTDLHILDGEFQCRNDQPVTLGHEFCGQVIEIGKKVTTLKVNDRVVVDPNKGCHICDDCHWGKPHFCQNANEFILGIYKDGGWATYCIVPEEQTMKLPDTIKFSHAALCEPLSCIAHGWDLIAPITIGQKILIIGAGIIGNLWAANLHLQGHRKVTISEMNPHRLEQVQKLNTNFELITPNQLKSLYSSDSNCGFDLIIDCSGSGPAIEQAVTLLNKGGKLMIFGVAPPTTKISISPFDIFVKEKTIIGTKINPFTFPKAIGLLESFGERYLNYDNLGIKIFSLNEHEQAVAELKKGNISKAVFKL